MTNTNTTDQQRLAQLDQAIRQTEMHITNAHITGDLLTVRVHSDKLRRLKFQRHQLIRRIER